MLSQLSLIFSKQKSILMNICYIRRWMVKQPGKQF